MSVWLGLTRWRSIGSLWLNRKCRGIFEHTEKLGLNCVLKLKLIDVTLRHIELVQIRLLEVRIAEHFGHFREEFEPLVISRL